MNGSDDDVDVVAGYQLVHVVRPFSRLSLIVDLNEFERAAAELVAMFGDILFEGVVDILAERTVGASERQHDTDTQGSALRDRRSGKCADAKTGDRCAAREFQSRAAIDV